MTDTILNDQKVAELALDDSFVEKESIEEENTGPRFFDLDRNGKIKYILKLTAITFLKTVGVLGALYFFVCSLDIMSLSFRLVGGRYVTEFFQNPIVKNPVAGLMLGIIVTVVVQSSSTSTSIIVSMVSAKVLAVRQAIPIIMGSNIGTSVTSTLVSLGHLGNKEDFQRAFAGAILHDIFNFLSVIILLPLEVASHALELLSGEMVGAFKRDPNAKEPEMLNAITKPLTSKIIQLDRSTLDKIAKNESFGNETLIKHVCGKENVTSGINQTSTQTVEVKCDFLFESLDWPEWGVGLLLLLISLVVLSTCLILLVKILSSIFKGHLKKILQKTVNADFPGPFKYLTPYVAIALGCGLTIMVQSSSVFTSALVPLVSMGLFSLERVFPLILGSNIGTTITGIMAALSSSSSTFTLSLQIAFCHTFFNIFGILLWYPIPVIRRIPIKIATYLSEVTGIYRWFAIVYLISIFVIMPMIVFGLSLAGSIPLIVVLSVFFFFVFFIIAINVIQRKRPTLLPLKLRTWDFLPRQMRSLEPYDKAVSFVFQKCCKRFKLHKIQPIKIENLQNTITEKPEMKTSVV